MIYVPRNTWRRVSRLWKRYEHHLFHDPQNHSKYQGCPECMKFEDYVVWKND